MGTVFNRGTKDNPNWYVGYRENGRWLYKAPRQPTKALAKRWVSEIESRIARGNVGIEDQEDAPQFKASFESFLEGPVNDDDEAGRTEENAEIVRRARAALSSRDEGFSREESIKRARAAVEAVRSQRR
jgi:hypothetical protein